MRDKLIELIQNAVGGCARHWAELIADALIANGVTIADVPDINVGDKWIHVSKRLPIAEWEKLHKETGRKVYPCFVYRNSFHFRKIRFITIANFDGVRFIDPDSGSPIGALVTHWMPLPEPPKEGE